MELDSLLILLKPFLKKAKSIISIPKVINNSNNSDNSDNEIVLGEGSSVIAELNKQLKEQLKI